MFARGRESVATMETIIVKDTSVSLLALVIEPFECHCIGNHICGRYLFRRCGSFLGTFFGIVQGTRLSVFVESVVYFCRADRPQYDNIEHTAHRNKFQIRGVF